jgi:hypothetical protein
MNRGVSGSAKGSDEVAHTRDMPDGPVGKVGRVLVRIRGGDAPGEVVVSVSGSPETYLAYGADGIPVGSDVLVVGSRGGRGVDVVPWDIALTPER